MNGVEQGIVDDAVEALSFARQGTIAEAANIPAERWDFRPHPDAKSVAELVRHMVDASLMLVGEATDPEGDFKRRSPREHVKAHAGHLPEEMGVEELLDALRDGGEQFARRVQEAGTELMMREITRFDGGSWKRVTYLFYAASHEDYHRGQLAMYARTMGLVPALTQRIHGAAAQG